MKVSFLRHAQTQANRDGILQGRTDTPISDIGVEQANEAAKKWKDISVDCVYCSPLLRARQTAEIVLKGRDIPVIFDDRLSERYFGEYQMRSVEDLLAAGFEWERSYSEYDYSLFGIESLGSVRDRVNSFLEDLKKEPFNHVLIISHGAVAMLFRLYFLGGKLLWDEQKIDNCHWVEYRLER